MMIRKSIANRVGYPSEAEVGHIPVDFHFAVRYALESNRPFVLIDYFISAYRLSEVSILRSPYASMIFDGHLGYDCLERVVASNKLEQDAQKIALARIAPLAAAGYLKVGKPREAARVFFRNYWLMEKTLLAKLALLTLILVDMAGFRTIDRYGGNIRALYDYFYKPQRK
jgi:hypothetical protein